jgi:hypothetical protein
MSKQARALAALLREELADIRPETSRRSPHRGRSSQSHASCCDIAMVRPPNRERADRLIGQSIERIERSARIIDQTCSCIHESRNELAQQRAAGWRQSRQQRPPSAHTA